MNLPDLRAAHRTGDHARCLQAFPGLLDELEGAGRQLRASALACDGLADTAARELARLRAENARLAAENRVLRANALVALDETGDDVPGAYLRGRE